MSKTEDIKKQDQEINIQEPVPPVKIDFTEADRTWIAERIKEILASGQLTLGAYTRQFEQEFADYCGVKEAIAVSSGTAALEIIFRTLEIEGKDVLVPTNTNYATAIAVIRAGGKPVFMDTDPLTLGTHPGEIVRRLTADTVGVVLVHIGGIVSQRLPEILDIASAKGIWLVEDAAHAHGSRLGATAAGAVGIAGAFSFYPTKVMTTAEGGMITTNDPDLADKARIYRDQGKETFNQNHHVLQGYAWRMSEPNALIGLRHLQRLDEMINARREAAAYYDSAFEDCSAFSVIQEPEEGICNYYKYTILPHKPVNRMMIKARLKEEFGIICGSEVYAEPLHRQPVFQQFNDSAMEKADYVCDNHFCLPVFSGITRQQLSRIVDGVRKVMNCE